MNLQDWFYRYFIETQGYNPVNTMVYGILLVVFVYVVFEVLRKLKVKIDERLALSISPFVLLGSLLRVLRDAGVLTGYLFVTPGIYFLIFGITFLTLLISIFLERKTETPYHKIMFIVGLILLGPTLGILKYRNFIGIGYVILLFLPWVIVLKIIPWLIENKTILGLHLFDATTTSVSIHFSGILWDISYVEQHPLPTYFMDLFGTPFSFIFLKLIAIALILIVIDKYSDDREFKNFIKLAIGILGAATGTRDFLRLFYLT